MSEIDALPKDLASRVTLVFTAQVDLAAKSSLELMMHLAPLARCDFVVTIQAVGSSQKLQALPWGFWIRALHKRASSICSLSVNFHLGVGLYGCGGPEVNEEVVRRWVASNNLSLRQVAVFLCARGAWIEVIVNF